jgi:LPS export ABC transporter protein LptC
LESELKYIRSILPLIFAVILVSSCHEQKEHTAPAIYDRDSVAVMTSYGVNMLISDSGLIKYKVVSERWEVNENRYPPRWTFDRGIFLEQFDEQFHVQSYIQCDTAYYFTNNKIWELRGRVHIRTKDGLRFSSEELFWNQNMHELYSNKYSHLITPERELQGRYFRSDERMTKYFVSNTKGSFEKSDFSGEGDTLRSAPDTVKQNIRHQTPPQRRSTKS